MFKERKFGFTLIELLAVIVILGILVTIAIPLFNNITQSSRNRSYEVQIERIETAARRWVIENPAEVNNDGITIVLISRLLNGGYFESSEELNNPLTGARMNGCVKIEYNNSYRQFTYEYIDNINNCD